MGRQLDHSWDRQRLRLCPSTAFAVGGPWCRGPVLHGPRCPQDLVDSPRRDPHSPAHLSDLTPAPAAPAPRLCTDSPRTRSSRFRLGGSGKFLKANVIFTRMSPNRAEACPQPS